MAHVLQIPGRVVDAAAEAEGREVPQLGLAASIRLSLVKAMLEEETKATTRNYQQSAEGKRARRVPKCTSDALEHGSAAAPCDR
mmetsp:Transcript_61595/g.102486  ORF Transcript_61595/g.102486 Transcript_61595/m.102486 type:complete len:84 (-) Transcript_61595:788-1039(-)